MTASREEQAPTMDSLLLQGSRELDAIIAEKVMGATWHDSDDVDRAVCNMRRMLGTPKQTLKLCERVICWRSVSGAMLLTNGRPADNLPCYSTDIAAAWEVVEWWANRGAKVNVMNRYAPSWGCNIITEPAASPASQFFVGSCASAPVAICRATLHALGAKHDQT